MVIGKPALSIGALSDSCYSHLNRGVGYRSIGHLGHVVIHCLRGELVVHAEAARHQLASGEALVLDPDVPHSVEAEGKSEMLLTVCKG